MLERTIQILSECHADTALVRFFFPDHKITIHERGCAEVANTMLSPRAKEYKFIGMVDNDKKLHIHCKGFFAEFENIKYVNKIFLKRHPVRGQYLVVIDKAIESFLIWNAEQVDVDLTKYGFRTSVKKFGDQIKSPAIETDENYRRLLDDLYVRRAPGFLTLEQMLNDLIVTR